MVSDNTQHFIINNMFFIRNYDIVATNYYLSLMNEFWEQLQLSNSATNEEIIRAWYLLPIEKQTDNLRLFVKAQLDPYYKKTLKYYPSLNQLMPAGFFDDKALPGKFNYIEQLNLFTTPVDKIIKQLNRIKLDIALGNDIKKPFIVLLNTGSYSPIHIGHIQMMEEAKTALQAQYHVLGGYMSPSHDLYVSTKYAGTAAYHSEARISLCQEVLHESPWLMVDPWEARYNHYPINFTDVILHLKSYLKHFIDLDIEVAYVFGSDNAGFTWAFIEQGISVCFERPNYELQYNTLKEDPFLDPARHYFIANNGNTYSSKAIREGADHFLPEKIKKLYFNYKNNAYLVHSHIYLVRDDGFNCIRFLSSDDNLNNALHNLKNDLTHAIHNAFKSYGLMNVHFLSVKEQNDYLNCEVFNTLNIMNVDLWTYRPGQSSLGISRLFQISDGQIYSNNLVARPGLPSIEEQISTINAGQYTLVDDDIASGATVKMIMNLLPHNIEVNQLNALSQHSFHETLGYDLSYQFHDIVDLRDFIIGTTYSGLVVALPNDTIGRAPYALPYVSLTHRAKIPHASQAQFNIDIWKFNVTFYSNLTTQLCIKDMDQYFINTCIFLQFDVNMSMVDFCSYHLKVFSHE